MHHGPGTVVGVWIFIELCPFSLLMGWILLWFTNELAKSWNVSVCSSIKWRWYCVFFSLPHLRKVLRTILEFSMLSGNLSHVIFLNLQKLSCWYRRRSGVPCGPAQAHAYFIIYYSYFETMTVGGRV